MNAAEKARGLRLAMYAGAILLTWLTRDGYRAHVIGALVTAAALFLYWAERPRFFRLVMLWCAGFLLIISGEGIIDATAIARRAGQTAYDQASRYLVVAHLATLLGHDLIFSERHLRPPARPIALRVRSVVPVLAVLTLIALVKFVPMVLSMYAQGRVQRDVEIASVGGALFQGLATSLSVAIPIIAVWSARSVRGNLRRALLALAFGMMAIQFVIGIRFLLLFAAMGSAIVWLVPRRPRGRIIAVFLVFALALWLASTVVRKTRTYGLGSADVGAVVGETSTDDLLLNEGVVNMMAMAVVYTRIRGFTDGKSSAAVFVFWIPRTLWEDKPTFMGYWLPRFFGTKGFSEGFSSAQGFGSNAYVDFGFTGGVVIWLLAGIGFGLVERRVASVCATEGDARVILVAPLYGATFFAVRTIDTTVLVILGVEVLMLATIIFAGERRSLAGTGTTA